MKQSNKNPLTTKKYIIFPILLALLALYYYIALPAINIHNASIWKFIIGIFVILFILYVIPRVTFTGRRNHPIEGNQLHKTFFFKLLACLILLTAALYGIGTLLSSPVINASKYQQLLTVEQSEFSEDITQISYDQIPLLDKSSAEILGNRKMGSLVDLASQFEVANSVSYTHLTLPTKRIV